MLIFFKCTGLDYTLSRLENTLNGIVKDQSDIKLLLNRTLSKIDKSIIEQPLSQLDASFLSKFPMNNLEEFMLVEKCIMDETEFVPKLVII